MDGASEECLNVLSLVEGRWSLDRVPIFAGEGVESSLSFRLLAKPSSSSQIVNVTDFRPFLPFDKRLFLPTAMIATSSQVAGWLLLEVDGKRRVSELDVQSAQARKSTVGPTLGSRCYCGTKAHLWLFA